MFTQQANSIAALFGQLGNGQLTQGMLQTFANCAQPLQTRAGVSINGAAGSKPPKGGVINSWPNEGSGVVNQYPGNSWNSQNPAAGGDNYYGDNNYWGGDSYYGDTLLQNQFTTNLGDWYQQTFTDNSYTDLRTMLETKINNYDQQISNFAGDNYFDNTTTNNNTTNNNVTNLGDVTNFGPVVNEGDVTNNNNTYLNENKTFFVTQEGNVINIAQVISNILVQIIGGGGGGGVPPLPPNLRLRGVGKITLPEYTLNPEDCSITPKAKDVTVEVAIEPIRR